MSIWTGTVTGERVDFLDPDPDSINIIDIARGISNLCRFTGQLNTMYTVAQHSLRCEAMVADLGGTQEECFQALMHDAHEAYVGDVSTPLKTLLGDSYRKIDKKIQQVVMMRFGLPMEIKPIVHEVDLALLLAERQQFQPHGPSWDGTKFEGMSSSLPPVTPLHPDVANVYFLKQFNLYSDGWAVVPIEDSPSFVSAKGKL